MEKIRQRTVVRQVMEQLKALIASGVYHVNDKIPTEKELAEKFGIGRSSIREAIKIFEHLGILSAKTGKGTFICDRANISKEALTWSILLGEHDLFEMVELREALERAAISRLVQRVRSSPEEARPDVARLEKNIELLAAAVKYSDIPALVSADYNFHGAIIEGSGNSVFSAMYGTLQSFMHVEISKTLEGVSISDQEVDKHRLIFDAIREGSLERALAAFDAHMEHTRARLRGSKADARG